MKKCILTILIYSFLFSISASASAETELLDPKVVTVNSCAGIYLTGTDAIGVLTDGFDTTYCKGGNNQGPTFFTFDFGQIPAGATVNSLSYFIRTNNPDPACSGGLIRPQRNGIDLGAGAHITATNTITNYVSQVTYDPSSTYGFKIYANSCGGNQHVYEYGMIVDYMIKISLPSIQTDALSDATVGLAYSDNMLVIEGFAPYSWQVLDSSLPPGLSINSVAGEIFGTPAVVGTFNVTVQVTDSNLEVATKLISITIRGNTPTGTNVLFGPLNGVSLEFSEVTQEGQTTVITSGMGQPPPTGFRLGAPPTYYSISTTATFTGNVEICVDYAGMQVGNENNLKLWHSDGVTWTDITATLDTGNDIICGLTSSFSDFAIFEKKQVEAVIDIKPGSLPNSINLGSNGTVPVAIFSTSEFDATTIDPLSVILASAPVQLKGNGTAMYSFQDVNTDGLLDMIVHVSTEALQLSEMDTSAHFIGYTSDSTEVIGSDMVRVVP